MKMLKRLIIIILGNLSIATGAAFFVIPFGFVGGGLTGIAMALEAAISLPTATGVAILQFAFLLLGLIALGKEYAAKSCLSVVAYTALFWVVELLQHRVGLLTQEPAVAMICAVMLYGLGISMIVSQGATSGGVDVVPIALNKRFGIPLSGMLGFVEILVVVVQVPWSTVSGVLHGALVTLGYTFLLGRLLAFGKARIQVQIYTGKYEDVRRMILFTLNRGATLLCVKGGYSQQDSYAVQTVVSNRDLFQLKERTLQIDPTAFIVVSHVTEVNGRGFTLDRGSQK